MKKIDVGQSVSILANIGVIIGIIFLVIELQQNTQAFRLASAQSYLSGSYNIDILIASDREFADLLIRGDVDENLTAAEKLSLERWYYAVFRQWETVYYQNSVDAIDSSFWSAYRNEIQKVLSRSPGMRKYWPTAIKSFIPSFQNEVNIILKQLTKNAK